MTKEERHCFWFGHQWDKWQDYLLDENDGLEWSPENLAIYIEPEYRSFRKCLRCGRVQDEKIYDNDRIIQVDNDNENTNKTRN